MNRLISQFEEEIKILEQSGPPEIVEENILGLYQRFVNNALDEKIITRLTESIIDHVDPCRLLQKMILNSKIGDDEIRAQFVCCCGLIEPDEMKAVLNQLKTYRYAVLEAINFDCLEMMAVYHLLNDVLIDPGNA